MKEHNHTWIADGETYTKTEHRDNCDYKNGDYDNTYLSESRDQAKKRCRKNCTKVRYRRYTCHCGEMKEVEYR